MKSSPATRRLPVGVIVGTRPEAVKLAPVISALARSRTLRPVTINTCQHRHMVAQILTDFGIASDFFLDVMRPRQTLSGLTSRLCGAMGEFLSHHRLGAVLVQGDTTSAFVGGLCAFYYKIPVGHVEAGLRSGDMYSPFPEEINRRMLGVLATWHFAPTNRSRDALLAENIDPRSIHVCGNTVVDALHYMIRRMKAYGGIRRPKPDDRRLVLITCHRRENLGAPMASVARAVERLARAHPEADFILPVHPNPAVREVIAPVLRALPNVCLTKPMDYDQFLSYLVRAHVVLSDSGGVQEEATSLGKPVLLLRRETERPEGIEAGVVKMVGTDEDRIYRLAHQLLASPKAWAAMARGSEVFGDGKSARRIVAILERSFRGETVPRGNSPKPAAPRSGRTKTPDNRRSPRQIPGRTRSGKKASS